MPTFLFTDIEGSTRRWQEHPEQMARMLKVHDRIIHTAIDANGGTVVKHTGDGFFVVFTGGSPLQCALDIQKSIQDAGQSGEMDMRVRIGLHHGEAERTGGDYFGSAVNKTARVAACAWGGQILYSEAVKAAGELPPCAQSEDLGLHVLKDLMEPVRLYSLTLPDLTLRDFPPVRTLSTSCHNLPAQTTPFVGREEELRSITTLIQDGSRLITLLGPGGIGKTRLAIQVAAEVFEDFDNGAFFVPLDSTDSPDFVVPAVTQALGFTVSGDESEKVQLLNYLRDKKMILIFDNFEHIMDGAPLVSDILSAAPGLIALVTSREAMNLLGENHYQVEGLDIRDADETGTTESAAVQLFLYHIGRVKAGWKLSSEDVRCIIDICRLLDGQPLGIELAASWIRCLTCSEIMGEIERNIDFLSSRRRDLPQRHRSLRAVFEYSWVLLTEEQREAMTGLSVFRGGFDRHAALEVTGADLTMLEDLMDRSLLRISPAGRYQMLYIIREYSGRKLAESDAVVDQAREAHCSYYTGLLERSVPEMLGPEQNTALDLVAEEIDNIRFAWEYALGATGLRDPESLARGLRIFFIRRGWFSQGRILFRSAASAVQDVPDGLLKALVTSFNALFGIHTGEIQEAREPLVASTGMMRELHAENDLADVLLTLGEMEKLLGNVNAAEEIMRESLSIAESIDDPRFRGDALKGLATVFDSMGDCRGTDEYASKALDIYTQLGDSFSIARCYSLIAGARMGMGEYDQAIEYYGRALEMNRTCGHKSAVATVLNNMAITFAMTDNEEMAERYFSESLAIRTEIGDLRGASAALANLGVLAHNYRDLETAIARYEEALKICREIGYQSGTGSHLSNLAQTWHDLKEFGKAKKLQLEALEISRSIDDRWLIERCLINLGLFCFRLGEIAESRRYHTECIRSTLEHGHAPLLSVALTGVARLIAAEGRNERAYRLLRFVLNHPATPSGIDLDVESEMAELDKVLTPGEVERCRLEAESDEMDGIVEEMLAYLED